MNCSPNETELADGFSTNCHLCESLKIGAAVAIMTTIFCDVSLVPAYYSYGGKFRHCLQCKAETLLLWWWKQNFFFETLVQIYRKVICNWLYVQSPSLSSRYLFSCLRNFCNLGTIWSVTFSQKNGSECCCYTSHYVLVQDPTYPFNNNFMTTKRRKVYKLRSSGAGPALLVLLFW